MRGSKITDRHDSIEVVIWEVRLTDEIVEGTEDDVRVLGELSCRCEIGTDPGIPESLLQVIHVKHLLCAVLLLQVFYLLLDLVPQHRRILLVLVQLLLVLTSSLKIPIQLAFKHSSQ